MAQDPALRQRNQSLVVDGLRLSFLVVARSYADARTAVDNLESLEGDDRTPLVLQTITNVWSMVDAVHRIRELVNSLPGLKKNTPEVRQFMDATANIEDLRHYVQHLSSEIPRLPIPSAPVWGSISWVSKRNPERCYTLHTGSRHGQTSSFSCAWDSEQTRWVQDLQLATDRITVDLTQVQLAIERFRAWLSAWAIENGYDFPTPGYTLMHVRLEFPDA